MESREKTRNLEAQSEELLALQSIYDDGILVIDEGVHPPSGRFLIRPKLLQPFHLTCSVHSNNNSKNAEPMSELKDVIVEYLPPITLHFELTDTYPTQTGPAFMLVCKWLTLEQLSNLCRKLDTLWEENGRDVILFCWMQFLQDEALYFLGISNSLDIGTLVLFNRKEQVNSSVKETIEKNISSNLAYMEIQDKKEDSFVNQRSTLLEKVDEINPTQNVKELNCLEMSCTKFCKKNSDFTCSKTPLVSRPLYNNEVSPKRIVHKSKKNFNKKWRFNEVTGKNIYKNLQYSNQSSLHEAQLNDELSEKNAIIEKIDKTKDNNGHNINSEEEKNQHSQDKNYGISHSNTLSKLEVEEKVDMDKIAYCLLQKQISMFKPCVHGGTGSYDQRAVLDLLTGRTLLSSLIEYNKLQKQEAFNNEWLTCKVCFTQKQGSHFFCFHGCNHLFCQDCIRSYFEIQIRDGSSHSLNCPEEKCSSQALPSQIKELVSADLYARYDASLLATTLDSMSDIHYCPRSHCQCATIVEPNGKMALCPSCGFVFCVYCKMVYHGVEPCRFKPEERKQIRDEYLQSSTEEKLKMEQRYGRRVLQVLVDETLSEEWIESFSKRCPHCNASIEKSDGCNKMACWRCGTYFCWLCMERLPQTNPYHHFNNPLSACFNQLFHGVLEMNEDDLFL